MSTLNFSIKNFADKTDLYQKLLQCKGKVFANTADAKDYKVFQTLNFAENVSMSFENDNDVNIFEASNYKCSCSN